MVPGSLGLGSVVLAAMAMLAPSRAARSAIALPMPRLAPLMNRVFPLSVAMGLLGMRSLDDWCYAVDGNERYAPRATPGGGGSGPRSPGQLGQRSGQAVAGGAGDRLRGHRHLAAVRDQ